MDYDVENLKLKDVDILSEFYKDFDKANIIYLSEIIYDDFSTILNKFKLSFSKTYKLNDKLQKIKKEISAHIINNSKISDKNGEVYLFDYIPIIKLNLSNRSFHFLMENNVRFVSQLIELTPDFSNKKGIGSLSYNEIEKTINAINIGEFNNIFNEFKNNKPYLKKTNSTINKLNLSQKTLEELKNKGFDNIDDIINFSFDDFYNYRLLSKKCSLEIVSNLSKFKENLIYNDEDNLIDFISEYKEIVDKFVYKNKDINAFDLDAINFDLRLKLNLNVNNTFLQLYNFIIKNISIFTVNELKSIYKFFKDNIPNNNIINLYLNITDEQLDVVKKRSEGFTLELIGSEYNLTRERIRQIETKTVEKIKSISKELNLEKYMVDDIYDELSITPIINDSYKKYFPILNYLIDIEKIIVDDKIYFAQINYIQKCNEILNNLVNQIEKIGFILAKDVDLSFIDKRILPYILKKFTVQYNGTSYYLQGKNSDKIIAYIKHFGLIDLSDDNLDAVQNDLKLYLDLDDFYKHNIVSMLGRYNIISIGDSKYTFSYNLPDLDENLLEDISRTIEEDNIVSCSDLILKYNNRLIPNVSSSALYFKLKGAFGDKFNYGGTNLTISVKSMSASKAAVIYDYLKNSDNPVKFVDLMNKFNIDRTSLYVIKQQNKDIFNIDDVNLWLFSKMQNLDSITEYMKNYINGKQSFFVNDMYRYMKDKYNDILLEDKINTAERFSSILKLRCNENLKDFEYDRFKKRYFRKNVNKESGFDFEF